MLNEVFLTYNEQILPFIKDQSKIESLLYEIKTSEQEIKMTIIKQLTNLIRTAPYIGKIINTYQLCNNDKSLSLIQILLDEYLIPDNLISFDNDNTNNDNELILYDLITLLIDTTYNRKTCCEYIFTKMKTFFNPNTNESTSQYKQFVMKQLLKIILFLYTSSQNETILNSNEPSTYFYFTIPNVVPFNIHLNEYNNKYASYDFKNSLSFTTWIYLEEPCSVYPCIKNNNDNYNSISSILFSVQYSQQTKSEQNTIALAIDKSNILKVFHNDTEICSYSSMQIPIQQWTQIKFKISFKRTLLYFLVDKDSNNYSHKINKSLISNSTIESFSLFNNFIGRVSSFIIGNEDLDARNVMDNFSKIKEEHLYPYEHGVISYKEIKDITSKIDNPICENVLHFFTPLYAEPTTNKIKDIITHSLYTLEPFPFIDCVNFKYKKETSIQQIYLQGGESQLLPILEIFILYKEDLLLNCNLIETFLQIILFQPIETLYLFVKNDIFKCLGLILSRFPNEIFNEKRKLFCLLWSVHSQFLNLNNNNKKNNQLVNNQINHQNANNNEMYKQEFLLEYFSCVLLNMDIFFKYSPHNQEAAWNIIKDLYNDCKHIIKKIFPSQAVINTLLYYDSKRQNKYCCKKHYEIFVHNNNGNDNPNENYITILSHDFKSFLLFVEKYIKDENTFIDEKIEIFKILNLDISPCLQLRLIDIMINFIFSIPNEKKIRSDFNDQFFQKKGIYTLLYMFRNNPLDIKCSVIELLNLSFTTLGHNLISDIMKYIKKVIIYENIQIPYINEENKEEVNNDIKLGYYIDKTKVPYVDLLEAFIYPGYKTNDGSKIKKNIQYSKSFVNESFVSLIELLTNSKDTQLINAFSGFLQSFYMSLTKPKQQEAYILHCKNNYLIQWITETNFIFYLLQEHTSNNSSNQSIVNNINLYNKDIIKYNSIYNKTSDIINNYFSIFKFTQFYYKYILKLSSYINDDNSHSYIVNMFNSIAQKFQNPNITPFKSNSNINDDVYFQFLDFTFIFFRYFITRKHDSQKMFALLSNLSSYTTQSFCLGITKDFNSASINDWEYTPTIKTILNIVKSIWHKLLTIQHKKFIKDKNNKDKNELLSSSYEKLKQQEHEKFILELVDVYREEKLLYKGLFSNKSFYSDLMKLMKYEFPNTNFTLLEVINSIFTGILTVLNISKNPREGREWIVEYQLYLIFITLSCINIKDPLCYKVFKYNYCLLVDICIRKKSRKEFAQLAEECLINITLLVNNLFKYNEKKNSKGDYVDTYIKNYEQEKELYFQGFFDILGQNFYHLEDLENESPFYSIKPIKNFFKNKKDMIINKLFESKNLIIKETEELKIEQLQLKLKKLFQKENNDNKDVLNYYEFLDNGTTPNSEMTNIVLENDANNNGIYNDTSIFKEVESEVKELLINRAVYLKNKEMNVNIIKKIYTQKKKELFLWNGSWSDKNVFYKNKNNKDSNNNTFPSLKYKVLNHYSTNFMRPFLVPMLDINYYLPTFTQYNLNNLFYNETFPLLQISSENKNTEETNQYNNIYQTSLNFDVIYPLNNESEILNPSNSSQLDKTFYDLIFECTSEAICNLYKSKNNINEFFDLSFTQDQVIKTFECCYVKQTHHIKGYLTITSDHIYFSAKNIHRLKIEEPKEKDIYYDEERKTCYGSVFQTHPKDNDFTYINIPYPNIICLLKRRYFLSWNSFEIFTRSNKNYYFSLRSNESLSNVFKLIETNISNIKTNSNLLSIQKIKAAKREIGLCYINKETKLGKSRNFVFDTFDNVLSCYKDGKISSFDFLMYINIIANRSYSDLTQYPVLPWIIFNGEADELPKITKPLSDSYRDLCVPIGMLENSDQSRKESFICNFNSMVLDLREEFLSNTASYAFQGTSTGNDEPIDYDEFNLPLSESERLFKAVQSHNEIPISQVPYYYGSHYSTPIYVTHFLVRLFPYSHTMIEMQGNRFDDPQRLFFDLANTIKSTKSQKSDVRELCPEFYYLPELFVNINNFNFGQYTNLNDELIRVNDVELPKWSNNDKYYVVYKNRTVMEKQSNALVQWIQLIFGEYQKDEKAREHQNVFTPSSYENFDIHKSYDNIDERKCALRTAELGLTPMQLFLKTFDIKDRKEDLITKHKKEGISFTEAIPLPIEQNRNKDKLTESNTIIYTQLNEDMLFTIFDNGNINTYTISKPDNIKLYKQFQLDHFYYLPSNIRTSIYHYKYLQYTFICKGQYLIVTGFIDMTLIIINLYKKESTYIIKPQNEITFPFIKDNTTITCMLCDNNERYLYCGTQGGSIIQFNINIISNTNLFTQKVVLTNCSEIIELNKIILNSENAVKYLSIDNTLNIIGAISSDNYLNIYTTPNMKLIRSLRTSPSISFFSFVNSPIPCILLYNNDTHTIITKGINSDDIIAVKEINEDEFISPILFKNYNFAQHLCYGSSNNNNNNIKIVKLPYLKEINNYTNIFKDDCGNIKHLLVNTYLSNTKNQHYIIAMTSKNKLSFLLSKSPHERSDSINSDNLNKVN